MRLSDILHLPKDAHSLPIIKSYLEQPLTHKEYQAAFGLYFEIANLLELYHVVFEEGIGLIDEFDAQSSTEYLPKLYHEIFYACLKLERYEDAKSLLEKYRHALPVMKQHLALQDEIQYKKALQLPITDELNRLLNDQVTDDVKVNALYELYTIYLNDHQDDLALNTLDELDKFDHVYNLDKERLEIYLRLDRQEDVLKNALDMLKNKVNTIDAVYALISVYFKRGEYHKASSIEAEYEDLIDQQDDNFKLKIFPLIIDLYKKIDSKFSIDLYQKKLKVVQKREEKKPKTEKVVIEENEKEKDVVVIEKITPKTKRSHPSILQFELAYDFMHYAHEIDQQLILRDYLRAFFMHVEPHINFKECFIYLNEGSPNFFHYKKERLYDKDLPAHRIEHSILSHMIETNNEIIESTQTLKWQKNIITDQDYNEDVGFIDAFPLSCGGAFVVYFEKDLGDPGQFYDILKLISAIIDGHLIEEKRLEEAKRDRRYYQRAFNSPIFYYRELTQTKSTYNDQAMELFQVEKHHHIELFLKDVSYEHIHLYKEALSNLFSHVGETKSISYKYQEKYIYEKMYSLKKGDEVIIMSTFNDQTENIKATQDLINKATHDQTSGLANMNALESDLNELIQDKASFILIELEHDLKQIYGNEKMMQYFREFGQQAKKFFDDGKTYRTDYRQILVVIPNNDIRTVTKVIKDYLKFIENYQSTVLKYEKFQVNMGVLRYPVVTTEKDLQKIMRFLNIALDKAKRDREEKFVFFVFSDYEDELFEQQVIDQLNLAIETKSLGLMFNQLTDIKKNRVWQYESELIIPNLSVDGKYLIAIAKKRNRLVDLERYHIERVCQFLSELEKETERLIKVTIPISKETFLDPTFNPYILGIFKTYGIPVEFVRLKCDMELRPNHYAPQIQELIDHAIALDTTSLEMALNYPFHALHLDIKKDSDKWQNYVVKVKELLETYHMALVIRNVKSREQKEALDHLGIQFIEGSIYKEINDRALIEKIKESL
ncbi:MAG: EAL domain-containing protein [Acholeplasmataceae bacterium]